MPDYKVSTGLPALPAGVPDKEFALVKPLYQALNSLAQGVSIANGSVTYSQDELAQQNQLSTLVTPAARRLFALAPVSILAYGKLVNLFISGGKIAAQYADATDPNKPAHGIVNEPLGIQVGDYGEIDLIEGLSQGISGSTFGHYYYLSSAGNVQAGQPVAVGTIVQGVGFGLGTGGFYMHISSYIKAN